LIGGRTRWVTTAQIIVMQAHTLADGGNRTCLRLLTNLMLAADVDDDQDEAIRVEIRP
jgi:hypothetical protein